MKKVLQTIVIRTITSFLFLLCLNVVMVNAKTVSKPWHMPLSGKTIVIDPGHGGVDGGAVGSETIIEKNIALAIGLQVRDYLQGQGALVVMTRDTDKDLAPAELKGYSKRKRIDLSKRVEIINNASTDMFISIHLNALPIRSVKGAQVFYQPTKEENKYLASKIQEELAVHFQTAKKEEKSISTIFLLKRAQPVGALVEVGFLSNPDERMLLNKVEYQERLSAAIYRGILRYYTDKTDK